MKQTIDLIYRRSASGQILTDREGTPVRIEDILSKIYHVDEGRLVLVRLRADDGRHEPLAFDIETLRSIQGRKLRGAFATEGGQKVNVYNSRLKGPWPILGATWDGIGLRWDAEGNPDNGDPKYRLCLLKEVDPDGVFLEIADGETTGQPEESGEEKAGTETTDGDKGESASGQEKEGQ